VLATAETLDLMRLRYGEDFAGTVQPVKYSGGSRLRRGQEHDFATVTQSVNMARARFRLVFSARLCQA